MGEPDRKRSPREQELIATVRRLCEPLPEVDVQIDGFGHTTFKVGKKSFVIIGGGEGTGSLSIKADPLTQEALVKRGPYIRTPYIGQHGWVTLSGDGEVDWDEVEELIGDAYRRSAPKRLLKRLEG